jgi:beta-lactamase superfamily II metal-dependent hydrolase
MTRTALALAIGAALTAGLLASPAQSPGTASTGSTLDIYVVDVEGGKAALFVAPSGQSVLVDTGFPGERDLNRIMEVINAAGVKKLDYLVSTHYHVDHVGNTLAIAERLPVDTFVDHGPSAEEREQVQGFQEKYAALHAKAKRIVVKPGDTLPIAGLDWRIVTSAAQVLQTPLPGGGQPNPACADFADKNITNDPDNGHSVGSVVAYGQFRLIDLGDLLWDVEGDLMCPNNPIGTVDLYMVTHHGSNQSNSRALVHGVRPRVAVMQNGTRKGGSPEAFDVMVSSPGFEDLWQLHWNYNGLIERNPAGVFIANVDDNETIAGILTAPPRGGGPGRGGGRGGGQAAAGGAGGQAPAAASGGAPAAGQAPTAGPAPAARGAAPAAGAGQGRAGGRAGGGGRGGGAAAHTPAHYIKVSAQSNGTFTVTNSRNGFSKTYTK